MTTQMTDNELHDLLQKLRLHALADELDDLLARAAKRRWSARMLIEEIVRSEQRERERRSLERRLKSARVGRFKPMADFDWNWPKKIDRQAVERAFSGALVAHRENLILVSAQGLGKTMIAKNLAHSTVLQGKSALFIEAARMLLDLSAQDSSRALERRLKHYARTDLLCIDEVGYLSYDSRAADMLFEVVNRRYEKNSTVITTNLAFSQWPTVFPGASCVTAMLDRLTHHAEIVLIEGQSYRRREAEETRKARRAKNTET